MENAEYEIQNMTLISTGRHEPDATGFWYLLAAVLALAIIFALVEKRERPKSASLLKNTLFGLLFFVTAVLGYVISFLVFICALFLIAGSLLWLVDQNLNSFSALTAIIDVIAVSIFIWIVRSKSLRQHIIKVWREIRGNL